MSYDDVLALIQSIVVANGNNEITADVLRPVLEDMLQQPNDLVGVLDDLDTSDKTSIVNAINSILNGNIANKTALRPIDTTGVDFNQDELLWVRDAINNTASNNGSFTCNLGEQMVFYCDIVVNSSGSVASVQRQYYRLTTGATEVSSLGTGNNPPLMSDGVDNMDIDLTGDLVIDLGDIGTDDIEDAFNADASQPFTINGDKFIQAIQNSENKLWQWIGGDGTFGNSATLASANDFVDLTGATSPPLANPKLNELIGDTSYESLTGVTTKTLNLNSFYFKHIVTDDDLEISFTGSPISPTGFQRRLELVIPTSKILTIPSATIIGDYIADGSTINQIDLYFTNYTTLGLRIVAIINNGSSNEITVNQTAHGFSVGEGIKHNGTIYVKAIADSVANADVTWIVSEVVDVDNVKLKPSGLLSGSYTNGASYYLSPATAGLIVTPAPTLTVGEVLQFVGTGTPDGLLINIDVGQEITEDIPPTEEEILGKLVTDSVSTTYNIDLSVASDFHLTMTADTEFTFTNTPTGTQVRRCKLRLTGEFAASWSQTGLNIYGDVYVGTKWNDVLVEMWLDGTIKGLLIFQQREAA